MSPLARVALPEVAGEFGGGQRLAGALVEIGEQIAEVGPRAQRVEVAVEEHVAALLPAQLEGFLQKVDGLLGIVGRSSLALLGGEGLIGGGGGDGASDEASGVVGQFIVVGEFLADCVRQFGQLGVPPLPPQHLGQRVVGVEDFSAERPIVGPRGLAARPGNSLLKP